MTSESQPGLRSAAWIVATVVLLAAIAAQGAGRWRTVPPARPPHLAAMIPAQPAGWSSRAVPLGASEFMVNEVEKTLRYDDVLNREYRRGADTFSVYVAYWGPGKMPTQLVASHTPDRCWGENGWRCRELRFRQSGLFAGQPLLPAEWRRFEPPQGGAPTYVLYWHLVDGAAYDYGDRSNAIPDPVRWWRGVVQDAVHGRREQYFIRLTGNRPLEELWADAGFRTVVAGLADLGLRPPPGS